MGLTMVLFDTHKKSKPDPRDGNAARKTMPAAEKGRGRKKSRPPDFACYRKMFLKKLMMRWKKARILAQKLMLPEP